MRFDQRAEFIKYSNETYDSETGNYISGTKESVFMYVSVSTLSAHAVSMILGDIKLNTIEIKTLRKLNFTFDRVRINDKLYKVISKNTSHTGDVFICTEANYDD